MNNWETLNPREGLRIILHSPFTDWDFKVLSYLYQPIIGAKAFALYMTLLTYLKKGATSSEDLSHAQLMDQLVFSKEDYIRSRHRLEGIGLLNVFMNKKKWEEPQVLYQLLAPVSSDKFFQDAIMSTLLLDHVGEKRFNQLKEQFSLSEYATIKAEDWDNITISFQDAYHQVSSYAKEATASFDTLIHVSSPKQLLDKKQMTFDMKYFVELVRGNFLSENAVTNTVKQMTLSLHQLYGMGEEDLAKFLLQAADIRTNQVDVSYYQSLAVKAAEETSLKASQIQRTEKVPTPPLSPPPLDVASQQLVQLAKAYPPASFARSIKEQKGGYLTAKEGHLLQKLLNQQVIDPGSLNILIHYYLVTENQSSLQANVVEATVNDWAQKGVRSPEQAVQYLNQRAMAIYQKKTAKLQKKKTYGRKTYQEVQPKWLKQKEKTDQKKEVPQKVDEGKTKALEKRIKALQKEDKA